MKDKKTILTFLNILLCFAAVVLVYLLLPYGVNACDEPYLIIETHRQDVSPLTPLSYIISKSIASLFGYKWIAYRGISVTLFVTAILTACFYFYHCSKNVNASLSLCWTMLTIFALQKDNWNSIYGYDCYSILFTTFYAIISLQYIRKPRWGLLVALGVVSGLSMLFRCPNLSGVPLAIALIIAKGVIDRGNSVISIIKRVVIYLSAFMVVIVAVCTLVYGSLTAYIARLTDMDVKGHGTDIVFGYIYHLFIYIVPYLSYLAAIYLLYGFVWRQKELNNKIMYLALASVLLFSTAELFVLWRLLFVLKPILIVAICMAIIIYALTHGREDASGYLSLSLLFAYGFVTALGSNGGLAKYMVYSMIPLAAIYVTDRNRVFWSSSLTVYLSVFVISVAALIKGTFVDYGLPHLHSKINHPLMSGLVTSESQAAICNQAISDFGKYADSDAANATVVGSFRDKYIYDYMFNCPNRYLTNVWDDPDYYNDQTVVSLIKQDILQSQKPYYVFFLKTQPGSMMEMMLDSISKRDKENDQYIIFAFTPDR